LVVGEFSHVFEDGAEVVAFVGATAGNFSFDDCVGSVQFIRALSTGASMRIITTRPVEGLGMTSASATTRAQIRSNRMRPTTAILLHSRLFTLGSNILRNCNLVCRLEFLDIEVLLSAYNPHAILPLPMILIGTMGLVRALMVGVIMG